MADAGSAAAGSAAEGGSPDTIELDPQLGVPLRTPRQAAAWQVMQDTERSRRVRDAWSTWRLSVSASLFLPLFAEEEPQAQPGGEEAATRSAEAVAVAVFIAERRLRTLGRAFRALWAYASLNREVWRRGHKCLLARERACTPQRCARCHRSVL